MTNDRKTTFIAEHNAGLTLREIAAKHGLSYQRVHQIIGGSTKNIKNWFKEIPPEKCIYPNIRKWMNDNCITRAELCRRLWGQVQPTQSLRVDSYLRGLSDPPKRTIDKLIETTGLTYELLFMEDKINENQT